MKELHNKPIKQYPLFFFFFFFFFSFLLSNKIYWYKKGAPYYIGSVQGSNTKITRIKKIKDRREWLVSQGKQLIQKSSKEK